MGRIILLTLEFLQILYIYVYIYKLMQAKCLVGFLSRFPDT